MSDETNEGKIIVFNPAGFILKLIFSIGMPILLTSSYKNSQVVNPGLLKVIGFALCAFVVCWFAASMFGFCLRATGNYLIAIILMVFLLAVFSYGLTWIGGKSELVGYIIGILFILFLIWLPINDIRKAILYIKNTV